MRKPAPHIDLDTGSTITGITLFAGELKVGDKVTGPKGYLGTITSVWPNKRSIAARKAWARRKETSLQKEAERLASAIEATPFMRAFRKEQKKW